MFILHGHYVCHLNPARGLHKPVHSQCWSQAWINWQGCGRKSTQCKTYASSIMWIINEIFIPDRSWPGSTATPPILWASMMPVEIMLLSGQGEREEDKPKNNRKNGEEREWKKEVGPQPNVPGFMFYPLYFIFVNFVIYRRLHKWSAGKESINRP